MRISAWKLAVLVAVLVWGSCCGAAVHFVWRGGALVDEGRVGAGVSCMILAGMALAFLLFGSFKGGSD